MSTETTACGHATNHLHGLEANPFETIVESSISDDLLKEGDEHTRAVLVRHGQVQVLQVEDQPVALFGPEDSAVT